MSQEPVSEIRIESHLERASLVERMKRDSPTLIAKPSGTLWMLAIVSVGIFVAVEIQAILANPRSDDGTLFVVAIIYSAILIGLWHHGRRGRKCVRDVYRRARDVVESWRFSARGVEYSISRTTDIEDHRIIFAFSFSWEFVPEIYCRRVGRLRLWNMGNEFRIKSDKLTQEAQRQLEQWWSEAQQQTVGAR